MAPTNKAGDQRSAYTLSVGITLISRLPVYSLVATGWLFRDLEAVESLSMVKEDVSILVAADMGART